MATVRDQVLHGDVLEQLKKLPDASVQCVVTSPPYWGLRDYGVEGQIGLEETPAEYVAKLVEVFREVWRVLRADGTLWLNLGDSYVAAPRGNKPGDFSTSSLTNPRRQDEISARFDKTRIGLKQKDLVGIPWRVAFALQEDGWYLRSDIIWAKPTVMPESVQDRPTKAHEYVFLLTKAPNYFYDAEAIKEPAGNWVENDKRYQEAAEETPRSEDEPAFQARLGKPTTGLVRKPITNRNKRSVWTIAPRPYQGAHFAVMPEEIPRLCILAGSSETGSCPTCGAPWERVVERGTSHYAELKGDRHWTDLQDDARKKGWTTRGGPTLSENGTMPSLKAAPRREIGWQPTCECPEALPVPCVVLDPFAGSGTTLAVAKALGRDYVGIELNPDYLPLIAARVRAPTLELEERGIFEMMMNLEDQPEKAPG